MTTRAKFICHSVTKMRHWTPGKGFLYAATFTAVTDGSEENKSFFDSTPSGEIKISTLKDDLFEPGVMYYVDFVRADPK